MLPPSEDGIVDTEDFYDYEKVKELLIDSDINGEIDWDLVKSAYDKGFNLFEIAELNPHLQKDEKQTTNKNLLKYGNSSKYMTSEEKSIANYYYNKYGKEKCDEYFKLMQEDLNSREGMTKALEFVKDLNLDDPNFDLGAAIKVHFKGLGDGIESFFHGIEVWGTGLSKEITADQYEAMYIMQLLKLSKKKINFGSGAESNYLEKIYKLSAAEGNIIPVVTVSTLGTLLGIPELGTAASIGMFMSISGNSAEGAYQQGYSLWKSWFYGCANGATSVMLERLIGGLPGIGGIWKKADTKLFTKILSEGGEETLENILDPLIRHATLGEDLSFTEEEINELLSSSFESGIDGMLLAASLNGGELAIKIGGKVTSTITTKFLEQNYKTINLLESQGIKVNYARIAEDGYLQNLLDNSKIIDIEKDPDLEKQINERMPQKLNSLGKARYIYNELNKQMAYSEEYFYAKDFSKKNKIYNERININNVIDSKIVCSSWSEMYCELLNKQGIKAKVMGNGHMWVAFELEDGTKWVADATQRYNFTSNNSGTTDLINSKMGLKSEGLFQVSPEMYNSNELLLGNNAIIAKKYSNEHFKNKINKIDKKLGYDFDTIEELFNETKTDSNKIANQILLNSPNATNGEIAASKLEKVILPKIEKMGIMEALGYYYSMAKTFEPQEMLLIESKQPYIKNGYKLQFTVNLENGQLATYIYDGSGTTVKKIIKNTE